MSQNEQPICPQCDQPVTNQDWSTDNVNLIAIEAGISVHKQFTATSETFIFPNSAFLEKMTLLH